MPFKWPKGKDTNGARPIETAAPFGLKILAEGIDPVLDIVAIHGINGGREETWTREGQNWLRDFLPQKITNARIYSWGYDAITHSPSQISHQHIYEHANTLLSNLYDERRISKTLERPIIFVAYSLGGIVLQMAMLKAPNYKEHQPIRLSTYGIIFMGTPHLGSDGADIGQLALNVASIFMSTNTKVVKSLKKDSVLLKQLLDDYGKISGEFDTTFAYETVETNIFMGKRQMIVPRASAVVPGARTIAIGADHIYMVKFASREDEGYRAVSDRLYFMAEAVEKKIRAVPEDIKKAQANMKDNFSVPFSLSGVPEAPQFVGRKKELIKIKEEFNCNGSQRKVVVLHGLGGIGKTQLAVASVKEHRDICSAIFWLNGKNEDSLKQSFVDMAKRLYNESQPSPLLTRALENNDTNQVVAALKNWFSSSGNTRWILVFDNVDNPKYPGISDPEAYDVSSYFPEAYQGSILITTRSSHLSIGKVVHVPVTKLVDIKESIIILASMSERQISNQDPCAIELVKELDGLPLALATAGAYLRQLSISLADYLSLYQERWKELLKKSPDFPSYRHRALNTTWDLSFQHIQRQNKSAEKLLQLWAYFDNQDLWFELLAAGREESPEWFAEIVKDELSFNEVIRLLCDHALIEPVHSVGGYSMHTCVRAWVVHMLDADQKISMARLALNCVGSAVSTNDIIELMKKGRRLLPHAHRCSKLIDTVIGVQGPENQKTYRAMHNLGYLFSFHDKMKEAKALYKRALEGFEKLLGPEHSSTLNEVYSLAHLYANQDHKMQEAEAMYWRVLAVQNKDEGPEQDFTLNIVNSLANLCFDQGKTQEAETLYKQALKGKEEALGPEHTSTLNTIYMLGTLYQRWGKMQEAATMYTRAIKGYEKACVPGHMERLDVINRLGNLYSHQGKIQEAETMYKQVLKSLEEGWGPKHTLTLDVVGSLGNLYLREMKMEEAEAMFLRALEVFEEVRGPEHKSTLSTIHHLATIYQFQGRIQEAKKMYWQVLEGCEKVWGPEHSSTLRTVCNLAYLYKNQGKFQEAEVMCRRALDGIEKVVGPEHTMILDMVNVFAGLFRNQGKLHEAEAMFRRVLEGYEKARGPEHESTLRTANNLGVVYSYQGKIQEAESMYTQAFQGCENTLGSEHTITLETVNNLGAISLKQGKIQEAETMYLRALKGKEKVWGTEHMSTIDTLSNLGILYATQDRMQDAEVMHLRALKGKMKALGPEHISTLGTIKCLTSLYKNQGKMESAEAMIRRALQSN